MHQLCSFSYWVFSLPSSLPWAICRRIQQTIGSPPSIIFLGKIHYVNFLLLSSWLHHICGLQSFEMFSSSFVSLYDPCFNTEMLVIGPWALSLALCAVYFHPSCVIAVLEVIQFFLYDILILWGIDTASRLCIVSILPNFSAVFFFLCQGHQWAY